MLMSNLAISLGNCLRIPLSAFLLAISLLFIIVLSHPPTTQSEDYEYSEEFADLDYIAATNKEAADKNILPFAEESAAESAEENNKEAEKPSWLEYKIKRGDTMDKILGKIGADKEARNFLNIQDLKSYRRLRRGDYLQFRLNEQQQLVALRYKTSPDYYLHAGRDDNGELWAKEMPPVLLTVTRQSGGLIESSLFAAADTAGISDSAIDLLITALETQVDFHRDTRKGDSFRATYTETQDEDGKIIGAGKLIAFEYISLLRPKKPNEIAGVYWEGKNTGYYSLEGESLQGAFLRAPLKFRRISSRFTNRRFHPVLKKWRAHRGVDYAAPSGTPVRATADGTISLVARQRGYGKVVMIKHHNIYTTVYAHLRGFAKNTRRGRKVRQGQVIGYVGQTGLATGPHLHYEFRVRGKHKNPLSSSVPKVRPPLKGEELNQFIAYATPLITQMGEIKI